MKKRGDMQIEILVALILGVLVLTFGIFGFMTNWDIFNKKICVLNNCYSNVDAVQNECKLACIEGDNETYCVKEIKLKLDEDTVEKGTCDSMSEKTFEGFEVEPCPYLCDYLKTDKEKKS